MNTAFQQATTIFSNAENFKSTIHVLRESPIDDLVRETNRLFSALQEEDDEETRSVKHMIWNIRSLIVFSLLPFDHPDLQLLEKLSSLEKLTRYFPSLTERMQLLSKIIRFLVENPRNLKREKVFDLLRSAGNGRGVGLVAALSHGSTPGWTGVLPSHIKAVSPHCEMLLSKRMLLEKTYRQVILPAGGATCNFADDLFFGCRTAILDIVAYQGERVRIPRKRTLPGGTLVTKSSRTSSATAVHEPEDSPDLTDEWAQRHFWESIRASMSSDASAFRNDRQNQFLVKARLVLLGDGRKVFLEDGARVIEVSDLLDHRTSLDDLPERFPRKEVNLLGAGDVIVLRTSGSGDYLAEVANSLMRDAGKDDLPRRALDWKTVLRKALEEFSPENVARRLLEMGFNISSPGYMWMWTTEAVMRPQSEKLFYALISILKELDYDLDEPEAGNGGSIRWKLMHEIQHYRRLAGNRIRQLLLEQLRQIIERGMAVTTCHRLTIPEVTAGELSICRIADIDIATSEVPYYRTGVVSGQGP